MNNLSPFESNVNPNEEGGLPLNRPNGVIGSSMRPQTGGVFGVAPADILFMLSRHLVMIALLGLLGIAGAIAAYFKSGTNYESDAKLLVRYVLERSAIDSEVDASVQNGHGRSSANAIQDEMQILTSWDLGKEVAEKIGPEKIIQPDPNDPEAGPITAAEAGQAIIRGLSVGNARNTNVISVAYQHHDREIVVPVMNELIARYFETHLRIHRSVGAAEFVMQQTDQVKQRLVEIDDELTRLKREAGKGLFAGETNPFGFGAAGADASSGTPSTWTGPPTWWASSRQRLLEAETERAAQAARIKILEEMLGRNQSQQQKADQDRPPSSPRPILPSPDQIARYETLIAQLSQLKSRNDSLRQRFPPGNRLIQSIEKEITPLESERLSLIANFPSLISRVTADGGSSSAQTAREQEQILDIEAEYALLAATEARIGVLKARVEEIRKAEERLPFLLSKIQGLERHREVEEGKYRYYSAAVDKARVDELLDPSKMPNINVVQSASPPVPVIDPKQTKIMVLLGGGGFGFGICLALAYELFIDRRIKRPQEFQNQLYIPLMLSIPRLHGNLFSSRRMAIGSSSKYDGGNGEGNDETEKWLVDSNEALFWPYAAAIRDRLFSIFHFSESNHKPKLIGMTSLTRGSGTSTLAKAVSAMSVASGEKVLLIDLNARRDEPHSIAEAKRLLLSKRGQERDLDSGTHSPGPNESKNGNEKGGEGMPTPRNLLELVPLLHGSDYGYVIFDMPPINTTSPTNSLATFMDIVLIVVDATSTDRDVVKQGYEELRKANSNVSCIYNKAKVTNPGDRKKAVAERRRQIVDDFAQR